MADVESLELQVKGNATGATRSVNNLIKTLEKLEKATAGGCGLGSVSYEMGKLKNLNIGLASATKSTGASFAKLATKVTAAWIALRKGSQMIASWITESNEYVENLNLFTVSMGEYAASAKEYAETVGEIMGIDPSAWMRNQGLFMTLATGFGVAGDRAATMSQQLTQLGYDLSSFFNISVEEAMQKLKSGFAGELEPLRNLGYDLSQAKLEAIALSLGIDKAVSSMTQAEKAQLRYYAIMTQVTTAQGDMSRTLDAPANQLRILKAQVTQAARALGNIFIPILNAVLPYAIALAKVIRILANAIAGLFGFALPEVDFGGVSAGAGEVGDEFEEAAGSAAKLKKILLGIDELNVMPDPSSGGGGSDAGGGGDFDFEVPTYDFIGDAVSDRVNEIVEKMKEWLGITDDINSWADLFDTRLGDILKVVGLIGAGFAAWKVTKGVLDAIAIIKSVLANPAQSIVIGVTLAITGITLAFSGMEDAIENGLDEFNFAEIVSGGLLGTAGAALFGTKLAAWITTAFSGSTVANALTTAAINLFGTTAGPITESAVASAGGVIAAAFTAIIVGIPTYFVGVYDAIKNGIDWLNGLLISLGATMSGAGIGALIGAAGGSVLGLPGALGGAIIGLIIGLITDLVILIIENWDSVAAFFGKMWDDIVSDWNQLVAFLKLAWNDIVSDWEAVASFFENVWSGISSGASSCWTAIVDFFSPAIEWFSQLFESIWQTISDIFYNIGVIAKGCWEIIQKAWEIAGTWFNDTIIQPVSTFFSDLWTKVKTLAINAWEGIKSAFSSIGAWINDKIVQPVSTFFSGLWEGFLNKAKAAWDGVKSVFSKVGAFFSETFQKAWSGVVKVFSIAGEIFTDIKDGIVSAFKAVVNGLIRGINKVVSIPFNAINSALMWLKNIEILGLTPFSSLKTINVPQIPYLAEGGVPDAGQMFVAREAGPELVGNVGRRTAVVNNDQIVESVSQGVYRAVVQAMGQSGGNQVVEAKVNDKVLFEVVVNRNRQETMRTGHSPLLGGA